MLQVLGRLRVTKLQKPDYLVDPKSVLVRIVMLLIILGHYGLHKN